MNAASGHSLPKWAGLGPIFRLRKRNNVRKNGTFLTMWIYTYVYNTMDDLWIYNKTDVLF